MEKFEELCRKCSKAERMTFSPGAEEDMSGFAALKASINSLIEQVLDRDFFHEAWKSFLLSHKEAGPSTSRSNMFRLLSGYRVIANYRMNVGEAIEIGDTQHNRYLDTALDAFVEAVIEQGGKEGFDADGFFDVFPAEGFTALLERLCKIERALGFVALLSQKWLLELLKLLVRLGRRRNHAHPSQYPGLLPLLEMMLQQYFWRSNDNDDKRLTEPTAALCEELLLQRPADKEITRAVVQAVPIQGGHLLYSMHAMAAMWSESSFVRKADGRAQSCLTSGLLAGLDRLGASSSSDRGQGQKAPFLYTHGPRGVSLLVSLSQGVGLYLDCADHEARLGGMRVACCFSSLTGHDLSFPELVEADKREKEKEEREREKKKAIMVTGKKRADKSGIQVGFLLSPRKGKGEEEKQEGEEDKEEDDSESDGGRYEFEAYDLGVEQELDDPDAYRSKEQSEGPLGLGVVGRHTNYLRSCLDMLRVDHSKPDAYEKQRISLGNIPRIVLSNPPDGPVLAPPLVRELISMGNHFNFDGFEVQKERALMALFTSFPTQSVPAATACIGSSSYTTGARMYATKLLANAAYALSGLDGPGPAGSGGDSERDKDKEKDTNKDDIKTVIRRPRKLALSKIERATFVNRFGAVASPLFISPLLQTLGQLLVPEREGGRRDNNSGLDSVFRLPDQDRKALILPVGNTSSPSRAGPALIAPIKQQQQQTSKIKLQRESDDDDDASVQWMLAADLLWTLGTCVRCSHNVFSFRGNLEGVLLVSASSFVRDHSSLLVRRAGLVCSYMCLDAWGKQRKQALQHYSSSCAHPSQLSSASINRGIGALETLQNLVRTSVAENEGVDVEAATLREPFQMDTVLGKPVTEYVEWCLTYLQEEPDQVSRELRAEAARAAVRLDDELVEQLEAAQGQ